MNLPLWIISYAVSSLFCWWILSRDGAERLEGSPLASFFLYLHANEWTADGIRLYCGGIWLIETIWFVVGLFSPTARLVLS